MSQYGACHTVSSITTATAGTSSVLESQCHNVIAIRSSAPTIPQMYVIYLEISIRVISERFKEGRLTLSMDIT